MKLQWSQVHYLNYDEALEYSKEYYRNQDASDKGLWKLPSLKQLKLYAETTNFVDRALWVYSSGLSSSLVCFLKDGSTSLQPKQKVHPTVFVRELQPVVLRWLASDQKNVSWYEAVKHTRSLGDGWRLPTLQEFQETTKLPQFLLNTQTNTPCNKYYWSVTKASTELLTAPVVNLQETSVDWYPKSHVGFCACYVKEQQEFNAVDYVTSTNYSELYKVLLNNVSKNVLCFVTYTSEAALRRDVCSVRYDGNRVVASVRGLTYFELSKLEFNEERFASLCTQLNLQWLPFVQSRNVEDRSSELQLSDEWED